MLIFTHSAREIVHALGGRGNQARCPANKDRTPSLSVTERDGKILLHCHAGCPQEAVIAALRDMGLWPERERRWLSNAEFKEECRRQDQRRERERQAAYFCLALEPLLLEAIERLPPVETIPLE
jgi:hypothetical protein